MVLFKSSCLERKEINKSKEYAAIFERWDCGEITLYDLDNNVRSEIIEINEEWGTYDGIHERETVISDKEFEL